MNGYYHCVLQTETCLWFLRAGRLAGTTMVGIIVGFIAGEPGAAPRRVWAQTGAASWSNSWPTTIDNNMKCQFFFCFQISTEIQETQEFPKNEECKNEIRGQHVSAMNFAKSSKCPFSLWKMGVQIITFPTVYHDQSSTCGHWRLLLGPSEDLRRPQQRGPLPRDTRNSRVYSSDFSEMSETQSYIHLW